MACMIHQIYEKIGRSIGGLIEVDVPANDIGSKNILQVRVGLKFMKPLARVKQLSLIIKKCGFQFDMKNYIESALNIGKSPMATKTIK